MRWLIVVTHKVYAMSSVSNRTRARTRMQLELDGKAHLLLHLSSDQFSCISLSAHPGAIAPHHQRYPTSDLLFKFEKWSTQGFNEVLSPIRLYRARHDVSPFINSPYPNLSTVVAASCLRISLASLSTSFVTRLLPISLRMFRIKHQTSQRGFLGVHCYNALW